MRVAVVLLSLSLATGGAYAAVNPSSSPSALPGDAFSLDTPFTIKANTHVPGKVLKPGGYTIAIKDHLSDRAILQVVGDNGKVEATFLGVYQGSRPGSSGPILVETEKGSAALRGFSFPGGRVLEFVYPKAEAAAIASRTSQEVLAIDPESDNLHTTGKSLNTEDAKIVTLWSLQATRVTPTEKGISAKKYVAQAAPQDTGVRPSTAVQPVTTASATPSVSAPATTAATAAPVTTAAPAKRPAPKTQVAANHLPSIKALPHTASNMPLLLFMAVFSLTAAGTLQLSRRATRER